MKPSLLIQANPDVMRRLIDLSVQAGRKLQSKETGFIHLPSGNGDNGSHLISIEDNFIFCLGLLKSKTQENMLEAKELLSKLLYFQHLYDGEHHGNFPLYIHEYPLCRDRYHGVSCLLPLSLIYAAFSTILGPELNHRIRQAIEKMVDHCISLNNERMPYWIQIVRACIVHFLGNLLKRSEWIQLSEDRLHKLAKIQDYTSCAVPSNQAKMLLTLMIAAPEKVMTSFSWLWEYAHQMWHDRLGCFVGPHLRLFYEGYDQELSLYDYLMGYLSERLPERINLPSYASLRACFIPEHVISLSKQEFPREFSAEFDSVKWGLFQDEKWAVSLLDAPFDPCNKGCTPCCLTIETEKGPYSLCIYNPLGKMVGCRVIDQRLILKFLWEGEIHTEDRDKARLINIFISASFLPKFSVDNSSTSTFEIGQQICIKTVSGTINAEFKLIKGEALLFGHLSKANRPSQKGLDGQDKYASYDWNLFLRAVEARPPIEIELELRY